MKWWDEAIRIEGLLPEEVRVPGYIPRVDWFFDGDHAIDPQKEASARDTDLSNGSTTHFDVYAQKGEDVRVKFEQIAEAKKLAEELGIAEIVFPPKFQETANRDNGDEDENEEENTEENQEEEAPAA